MIRRILFAWEMGDNFGHLTRDLGIAVKLREMGHEVLFAVRDTEIAEQLLTPAGFRFIPTPTPVRTIRLAKPAASYTEILIGRGYADKMILAGLVRAWLQILELARPDAVVIDHAPTALLAARIGGIPTALIGTGFEIPPNTTPLPSIRPWDPLTPQQLEIADRMLLRSVNLVLSSHNRTPLARVCDLFADCYALLTTFPALDHYGPRAEREYIGPLAAHSNALRVEWPSDARNRVFVYLRAPFTQFDALFSAFSELDINAVCVIPRHTAELGRRFADRKIRLFSNPICMQTILAQANVVVNYGGAGTIATTLLAGVPMLLIPNAVEQYLGSRRVIQLEAGIVVERDPIQKSYATALRTLMTDARFRDAAYAFSKGHRGFNSENALQRAATAVTKLAGRVPAHPNIG